MMCTAEKLENSIHGIDCQIDYIQQNLDALDLNNIIQLVQSVEKLKRLIESNTNSNVLVN